MKRKLLIVISMSILFFPKFSSGQVVSLGPDASKFVIYTSIGAIDDNAVAVSHITGDVGTNTPGAITDFGNVDGIMHPGADLVTAACDIDLSATIAQINAAPATIFPSALLGNGVVFTPGIYSIPGNATLTLDLILDGQGNSNAEFIIKIGGTFNPAANAKVKLINGAQACHVYWNVTGSVTMATLVTMRGNLISGGAITMGSLDSLEGRAFSTVGQIEIDQLTAFKPLGCGTPLLTGPPSPDLASLFCYTIFSSNGALANTGVTTSVIGDVGKNNDGSSITGWAPANVTGALHSLQDPSTILAAADLSNLYNDLNAMVPEIELLFPAQFGNNLVLTPHVYVMNSAATLTDSITFDAQGNQDAVFVIKILNGALTTSVNANVKLINGAKPENVFWMVEGAVSINNNSKFRGTIVIQSGALNLLNTNVLLEGRALTMNGAITTEGLTAIMPSGCNMPPTVSTQPKDTTVCLGSSASFSVVASGVGITYQWRRGLVNLVDGGNISGATTDTLVIDPVNYSDTASNYNLFINGGPDFTSNNVSLIVNAPPVITTEPINQQVCIDSLARFNVVATGDNLVYQWRNGPTNLSNNGNVLGANSSVLTINPVVYSDYSISYNVIVSGCAPSDTSINVSLIVDSCSVPVALDFFIPDGFSPNNDGINDVFVIRGILRYPSNTFVIFNRWGNKIFETSSYQNTWDGRSSIGLRVGGDELPVGTYFYVLDLGDGSPIYKGTIYLNR